MHNRRTARRTTRAPDSPIQIAALRRYDLATAGVLLAARHAVWRYEQLGDMAAIEDVGRAVAARDRATAALDGLIRRIPARMAGA